MKKFTFSILLSILILQLVSAQAFKKPHQFTISSGAKIENKILTKPSGFLPKLESSIVPVINPSYRSMEGQQLQTGKTAMQVIQMNEEGIPIRFITSNKHPQIQMPDAQYWAEQLPKSLSLPDYAGTAFTLRSEEKDNQGIIHIKYDQAFEGIPVFNGEYFVHIYPDQKVMAHGVVHLPDQYFEAKIDSKEAYNQAQIELEKTGIHFAADNVEHPAFIKLGLQQSRLVYWFNPAKSEWHLVYELDVYPTAMTRYTVLTDAVSGKVVKYYQKHCLLAHADKEHKHETPLNSVPPQGAEVTTAKDLMDVTRSLNVWRDNSTVYLIDGSRPMFKPGSFKLDNPIGAIWTLDAKSTNPNNLKVDQIKSTTNTWAKNAVSAHYNAGIAFEYYTNTHARNSINGIGGSIISVVNVNDESGGGLDNAFWNGQAMFYGNGAQSFMPLARGLDVAGHEMSHGVIESTANLDYEGESGAINESFADVFGVLIDRDDWKVGEDVVRLGEFPSGALRNMSDPHNGAQTNDFGRWQPRHVNEQYKGTADNGGVHINSGIPNYAFYLFVQEMAKTSNEAAAKGVAEKVYYKALSQYLTRSSKFKELRPAVEQACIDLHGNNSAVHNAAKKAFDMVGIGSSGTPGGGGTNYQKDLPVNPGKEFVVCTDDNFDGVYLINLSSGAITQLSQNAVKSKPSVSDDGSEIYYVGDDSKLYGLFYNTSTKLYQEFILDSDPIYRNACISKDGSFLAVLYEQAENKIHVYQFANQKWNTFTLNNPTTGSGVNTSNVKYADFLDFEHSGQYLMYDCLSEFDNGTSTPYEYWDIGFVRVFDLQTKAVGDGHIEKLFGDIPENVSIGNPVFSKNSPYIIAFDYVEAQSSFNTYSLLGANVETGDVGEIAINRDDLGFASYSVNDDFLLYDGVNTSGDISLKYKPLAKSKIASNGNELLFVNGARYGSWFADGKRSLVKTVSLPGLTAVSVSPNPFVDHIVINLESKEALDVNAKIVNAAGEIVKNQNYSMISGSNQFVMNTDDLTSGVYFLSLTTKNGFAGLSLIKSGN